MGFHLAAFVEYIHASDESRRGAASFLQGDWKVPEPLYTDAADVQYPWWQSRRLIVPASEALEFKIGEDDTSSLASRAFETVTEKA
jgi:hypothetical protein